MATIAAKASRRAHVNIKLTELSEELASTFDIEIPPVPGTTRDPELDQIIALERIAMIFERVLNGEPESVDGETETADDEEPRIWANPGFVDMSREDLDRIAVDWYQIDPSEYADDEALRLALVDAYKKDTGGVGETPPDGSEIEDLATLKLDVLKARAIAAGHDADLVNKKRSKKEVIAILNGETEPEESEE